MNIRKIGPVCLYVSILRLFIVNIQLTVWMSQDELASELRKQVATLEKANKNQWQENAEEINRLHRSLKESQQECRDLLEAR